MTAIGGARQGAVFALAVSMTSVLDFVTSGVGVSLVVQASSRPDHEWVLIRSAMRRTVPLVAVLAIAVVAISPLLFRLLNPSYIDLGAVKIVTLLAVTSVVRTVYLLWSSLQQARQQLRFVLWLNAIAALVAYVLISLTVADHGAYAAAIAVAVAQVILSGGAVGHMIRSWRTRNRSEAVA